MDLVFLFQKFYINLEIYLKKKINYEFVKKRKGDIIVSISNSSKLKKIINWKPKHQSLNDLVQSSLNWYKKMAK